MRGGQRDHLLTVVGSRRLSGLVGGGFVQRRRLEQQRRERCEQLAGVTRGELLVRLVHDRVQPRVGERGEYVCDGEPLVSAGVLGVRARFLSRAGAVHRSLKVFLG